MRAVIRDYKVHSGFKETLESKNCDDYLNGKDKTFLNIYYNFCLVC